MRNPLFGKIIIVKENIEERNPVLERERNLNWETDYQSTKPWLGNRLPINETLIGKQIINQRNPGWETEYQSTKPWLGNGVPINEVLIWKPINKNLIGKKNINQRSPVWIIDYQERKP